jgi:hypothetical protein
MSKMAETMVPLLTCPLFEPNALVILTPFRGRLYPNSGLISVIINGEKPGI